ncbi:MAG: 5-formyltetrahydrofolate cyclo-ligase [Planctomycetes bacterium]|nr:5-formyltetrahydrofolate cyclo-ligase [Planctomycetota bacterium]
MTAPDEEILAAKRRARRILSEALAHLTPSDRRAASVALAERLSAVPAVRDARTLMAFLSLPTEISTWPIIRWAWGRGKRVVVPRVEAAAGGGAGPVAGRRIVPVLLEPADVASAGEHPAVRPGPLGILEVPGAPEVPPAEIDVVLAPCQAVDRTGRRLGKGGGFYDRFFADPGLRARRIAIGFRDQVVDEVPVTGSDKGVDMAVTDTETLTFDGNEQAG